MAKKVVVDSSVIVKWVNRENEQDLDEADSLLNDVLVGRVELIAPELAKYEVGNVLLAAKKLEVGKAKKVFEIFYSLPVQFIAETLGHAEETYATGSKSGITYYDASFVALAKKEGAILITDNPKHQQKFPDVKVIPLKDYR